MDDSILLGRLADFIDGEETQEEVNEQSLLFYNQRELLDKISNKTVSKYEIKYLVEQLNDSDGMFWNTVLKEIIKVYNLSTLKLIIDTEFSEFGISAIKELLIFLKIKLGDIIFEKPLPLGREELIKYMKKNKAHPHLIFALETIDRESLENFRQFIV